MSPRDAAAVAARSGDDALLADRRAAVEAALAGVTDPELDEPVTAMGFIVGTTIAGDAVAVSFRLPTFWCSATFAFLMAADMKAAIESLAWVRRADVRLFDHFASSKINRGVADGASFGAVFADEATGELDAIRRTFAEKAFLGRQERLLRALAAREGVAATLATNLDGLVRLAREDDAEIRGLAVRYLALRRGFGGASDGASPAFTRLDGTAVAAVDYVQHLREVRRVRSAAEANAEMCRMLLAARQEAAASGHFPSELEEVE